jgi:hypothetical protein
MYAAVSFALGDKIQATFSGTFSASYYCSYNNNTNGLAVKYGSVSSNTTIDLTLPPGAASQTNQVQAISIVNSASSSSLTVIIQYFDGSNDYTLFEVMSLGAGYTLTYTADGAGFQVYDTNGDRQ